MSKSQVYYAVRQIDVHRTRILTISTNVDPSKFEDEIKRLSCVDRDSSVCKELFQLIAVSARSEEYATKLFGQFTDKVVVLKEAEVSKAGTKEDASGLMVLAAIISNGIQYTRDTECIASDAIELAETIQAKAKERYSVVKTTIVDVAQKHTIYTEDSTS